MEFFFLSFGYIALQMLLAPVRLRLFTEFFDEAQYGLINLVVMVVNALVFLVSLGTFEFLVRRLPGREETYQMVVFGKVLRMMLPAMMLLSLLGAPLAYLLFGGEDFTKRDTMAAAVATVLHAIMVFRVYFLLGRGELLRFRLCQLLAMDFWFFAALVALPFAPDSMNKVTLVLWVWAGWLAFVVVVTESWGSIAKTYGLGRASPENAASILTFSVPLLPMILGELLIRLVDRTFVIGYAGAAAMGEYTATMSIALIVYMVGASVVGLLIPEFNRVINNLSEGAQADRDPELQRMFSVMLRYALVLALCGAAVLVLLGPEVMAILVSEPFRDAAYILPWAAPVSFFFLLHIVFSRVLIAQDRSKLVGGLTLAAGLLNILLNALIIPRVGEHAGLGAAVATGISLAALACATGWAVKAWRWIDPAALRPLRIGLGCVAITAVFHLTNWLIPTWHGNVTVEALVMLGLNGAAAFGLLFVFGLLSPKDLPRGK